MPVIQRKGAQSSQGFGEFAQSSSTAAANYIEDYFSTYLYTGTGAAQTIANGIGLADTAAWSSYKLQQNSSIGYGVTTDSSGNFYVTGYANDGTNYYIIVAKYNSSGTIQWQRKLLENNSFGYAITTDSSGNIYVTGSARDGSGYDYIIVAKYNSSGTIQWQRKLLQNNSYGYGITTDSSGNVYITGVANLDGANNYIIIAKYNSSGTIQWQRKLRQNLSQGQGIVTDSSGNVYITGVANDGANNYIIIAKYNSSGTIQWQRNLKQGASYGSGITIDTSSNVYVTGYASDGSGTYIIIAKYNSSGTIQWQRKLRQSGSSGNGITTDSSGNVYVTGSAVDGTDYIIAAKYDSSGTIQWQRKLRQNASQGYAITADSSGNVYVTGYANNGANNYIVTSKLKQDGTTTSGLAFVSMVPGTATDGAGTATDSAGAATDSAAGATDSAAGATDSAGTATASSATQAAVTGGSGLVWIKSRSGAYNHNLFDTTNGATKLLHSNTTAALTTDTASLTSFFAGGFNLGTGNTANNEVNTNTATFASWTFRKQAKFFDIVTYTGNGAARTIPHNLGSVPGCIMIKRTSSTVNWAVYHRSLANTENLYLNLSNAAATGQLTIWNSTTPTSTVFSVGSDTIVNASGSTYVAYLFAHNAGGFGAAGTDNVISCGSFTTDGSGNATVTLGYEPQWLISKSSTSINDWYMEDVIRGWGVTGKQDLWANASNAELFGTGIVPTATGFTYSFAANTTYIYIAVRRGPMKTPTVGTSVFGLNARTGTGAIATVIGGQNVDDAALIKNRGSAVADLFSSRLTGTGYLVTSTTAAEVAAGTTILQANPWDVMDGVKVGTTSTITNASGNTFINYLFQRAPGFFDVVCYTGNGTAGTTQAHNLGVAPELMIIKSRSSAGTNWGVGLPSLTNREIYLDLAGSYGSGNTTVSTASTFTLQNMGGTANINASGQTYVAYLFASCPGVSKVGSYTGTGALQTVNCGFTSGARFVLIKRTDSTGAWYVWDSARGISSANDPYFLLNSAAAEVTSTNYVDTDTTGFKVTAAAPADINASGGSYIFLAIA